ncbi:hypothetical protein H4R19_000418 [Coemansia spiralis]|nr:hypothetical protein H4R19_000418 [Coemansia spiralis]
MGLRERTDANLQLVSLGWTVAMLLWLTAARRYTGDWRERRGFRRHLAATQQRLTASPPPPPQQQQQDRANPAGQRRKWKRFVAAVPLVPLATAYVAARVGWDVFEVLVFCGIDLVCDAAVAARALAVCGQAWACATWQRLDARTRIEAAVVAVVEGSVGWLFATGFPAVAAAAGWAHAQTITAARWWAHRGGPAFCDASEAVVLRGLVPAARATWTAAAAACHRLEWLAARAAAAAAILGADLMHDIRTLRQAIVDFSAWAQSEQRWWFDPRLRRTAARCAAAGHRLARAALALAALALPQCAAAVQAAAVWMYSAGLRPLAAWATRAADRLLQNAAGLGVHVWALCVPLAAAVSNCVRALLAGLSRCARALATLAVRARAAMARLQPVATAVAIRAAEACHTAYYWALRVGQAMLASALWHRFAAAGPWLRTVGGQAAALGRLLGQALAAATLQLWSATLTAVAALRAQLAALWPVMCVHWRQACVVVQTAGAMAAPHMAQLARSIAPWAERQLVLLRPALAQAAADAARAMADVYQLLAAAVDAAVVVVGDTVVEFARRSAVHPAPAPRPDTPANRPKSD